MINPRGDSNDPQEFKVSFTAPYRLAFRITPASFCKYGCKKIQQCSVMSHLSLELFCLNTDTRGHRYHHWRYYNFVWYCKCYFIHNGFKPGPCITKHFAGFPWISQATSCKEFKNGIEIATKVSCVLLTHQCNFSLKFHDVRVVISYFRMIRLIARPSSPSEWRLTSSNGSSETARDLQFSLSVFTRNDSP